MDPDTYGREYANRRPGRVSSGDDFFATLVHEYGHAIARILLGYREKSGNEGFSLFEELFPNPDSIAVPHPISDYAATTIGESFAEYFREAFMHVMQNKSFPEESDELFKYIQFYKEKVAPAEPVLKFPPTLQKRLTPYLAVSSDDMVSNELRFPKPTPGNMTDESYIKEHNGRSEFYRNGLAPDGTLLRPSHASIIKNLYAIINADAIGYSNTNSAEARDNYVSGIKVLKSFYDSLFFGYAKSESKNNIKSVTSRLSEGPTKFRSWTSGESFLGLSLGSGTYKNETEGSIVFLTLAR
jgi:hypothetical protein